MPGDTRNPFSELVAQQKTHPMQMFERDSKKRSLETSTDKKVDPYTHINVVCVVDPKNNSKNMQNTANIEFNPENGRFDLVYFNKD